MNQNKKGLICALDEYASMKNDLSSDQFMLSTLPETNKVLEHRSSQKEFHLPTIHFQGQTVRFRDVLNICLQPQNLPVFFGTSLATAKHPKGLGGHQTHKRRKGIEGVGICHHIKI